MLTEEEAAKKWCPMARVLPFTPVPQDSYNRRAEDEEWPNTRCIVDRCMMWRWATFFKNSATGEWPMREGAYETGTAAECGWCGLAGEPKGQSS